MKNLLLFAALLVVSTGAIAQTGLINPQQKYAEVGTINGGEATFYVTLSGPGAPREISQDMVLYQVLYVQNIGTYGMPKGMKSDVLYLIDCSVRRYKSVSGAIRYPGSTVENQFTDDSLKMQGETAVDLAKESWKPLSPLSLIAADSDAACKYVKNHKS